MSDDQVTRRIPEIVDLKMTAEPIRELYGGEIYEYYPLGEYIVSASRICNGRPTFKYTRIEAAGALNLLAASYSIEQIAQRFGVPHQAIEEAIRLAGVRLDTWMVAA